MFPRSNPDGRALGWIAQLGLPYSMARHFLAKIKPNDFGVLVWLVSNSNVCPYINYSCSGELGQV